MNASQSGVASGETDATDQTVLVNIRGVINPASLQRIHLSRGKGGLLLTLCPWRIVNGALNTTPLRIQLNLHYRTVDSFARKLLDLTVITGQIRYDAALVSGQLLGSFQSAIDEELSLVARDASSPIFVLDEAFGKLNFVRARANYEGFAMWRKLPVTVVAFADEALSPSAALGVLKRVWLNPHAIADIAVSKTWPLRIWSRSTDKVVHHDVFLESHPHKVCADSHGNFTFFFTPGRSNGLVGFRGHVTELPEIVHSDSHR